MRRVGQRCKQWRRILVAAKIAPQHVALLKKLDAVLGTKPPSRVFAEVLLYKGLIYSYYGHEDKALPLLLRVATKLKAAAPAVARRAASQVLHILIANKQKAKLRSYLKRFLADKQLMSNPSFAGRLRQLELHRRWKQADGFRRQGKHRKCGDLFGELARRSSKHPRGAVLLFNAAVCYEAAGALGKTIGLRRLLVQRYPKARYTPMAVYYLAGNYRTMFFPEKAAQWYGRFARQYPKRKEAPAALMWAIVFRSGMLQLKQAARLVKLYIKNYSRYRRYRFAVAKAAWMLVKLEDEWGSRDVYHRRLLRYLKRHARTGPVDKHIEALARVGQIAWEKSCKVTMTGGLCLRIRFYRKRGSKKKLRRLIYLARNRRQVATAKRYFALALRVWANGRGLVKILKYSPDRAEQVRNARHHAAQAMFMRAEFGLEKILRRRVPAGLNFDPKRPTARKRSEERLQKWLLERTRAAEGLIRQYMHTLTEVRVLVNGKKRGDPHWALAAVSRTGLLYQAFGEALLDLPVPRKLRGVAAKDAFGSVTNRYSKPLLTQAKVRYRICRKIAHNLRWYNEWSTRCSRALNRLDPSRYPLGLERYGRPGYLSTSIAPAGFQ